MTGKQVVVLIVLCIWWVMPAFAQSNTIQSGDMVEGQLKEDSMEALYTFSAGKGDTITVTLSSRQFDPLLLLIDTDGNEVTRNDDSQGSLNSVIEDFEIPADGDYSLVVTSSSGTETGKYKLTFDKVDLQVLSYGDHVQATLQQNEQDVYQFEGQQGDVISIRMESDTIDSYVSLSDENTELIADDNSNSGWDAMISAFTLPQTGIYQITASSAYGDFSADSTYTLYLDWVDASPITVNEPITATISGEPLYFTFEPQMGDTISIFVTSDGGQLDTLLNLKSEYTWYGIDDDSGYLYDPELVNMVVTTPMPHTIIVLPANDSIKGDFELVVQSQPAQEIVCDSATTLAFSNKVSQMPLRMEVGRGQKVELTFINSSGNTTNFFSYFTLNDDYIAEDYNVYDEEVWTTSVTATESGQLNIMATDYSQHMTTYQLDVRCS